MEGFYWEDATESVQQIRVHLLPLCTLCFFFLLTLFSFLAVLGLCCFARAFSSCSEQGPLFFCCGVWASRCDGFSCCRAQALGVQASVDAAQGSVVAAPGLWSADSVALWPVGSSQARGWTPCSLHWQVDSYCCATREVFIFYFEGGNG